MVPNNFYASIAQAPIPAGQIPVGALVDPLTAWIIYLAALTAAVVVLWFVGRPRKVGWYRRYRRPLRSVPSPRVVAPQQA